MGDHPFRVEAVLVRGGLEESYRQDMAYVYRRLRAQGIPADSIHVVDPGRSEAGYGDWDGDGRSDVDFSLSKDSIQEALRRAGRALQGSPGQLLFYATSHGSLMGSSFQLADGNFHLGGVPTLSAAELDRFVDESLPPGRQAVFVIDACFSGRWRPLADTPDRWLFASAGEYALAGSGEYEGRPMGDFTYAFFSALTGTGREQYRHAFQSAQRQELAAEPQFVEGSPPPPPQPSLWSRFGSWLASFF